ncbi:uncharacterized protein LOC122073757 [Macadamia integrifolia]|uniref:uncharacterized protein LOC122073757 n=1 Tax=Macadamia integrifolia TaxID=60698 RepID=UPI001C4FBD82|nr:uncharacterized protein LOC122073757 [Macadamia integrifolia]
MHKTKGYTALINFFSQIGSLRIGVESQISPFLEFFNEAALVELPFTGPVYTWDNRQIGYHQIEERLDRFSSSPDWLATNPNAIVQHQQVTSSDHKALILSTELQQPSLPEPFRFEAFWVQEPSFHDLVAQAWTVQASDESTSFLVNSEV